MTVSQPARDLPVAGAVLALVAGAVAMGVSPVFVRLAEVGPFASAFWRVATALPLLLVWAAWEARRRGLTLADTMRFDIPVLLVGLTFAGDLIFWHLAILNTTIANATFMSCLAPVWVILLSGLLIGEPVNRQAVIGLVLCLGGAGLLIGASYAVAPERLLGDIYGFITSIFFGLYFLAVRVARRTHGAGALTFLGGIVTSALLLVFALAMGSTMLPATMAGLTALLALGLVSHSGGQGLLALALGALSAAFSSLVIFIEALAAAVFGWLVFSEALSPTQVAGGGLILLGIWIARPRAA